MAAQVQVENMEEYRDARRGGAEEVRGERVGVDIEIRRKVTFMGAATLSMAAMARWMRA